MHKQNLHVASLISGGKRERERERKTDIHRNKGNMPHWCRKPSPVVTSRTNRTSTASIAALPFQVSALFVQPHSHIVTSGGSSLRCESYAANNSSTLPRGTKDCKNPNLRSDHTGDTEGMHDNKAQSGQL